MKKQKKFSLILPYFTWKRMYYYAKDVRHVIGCLFGTPALRGYFFGVFFTFSIKISDRSLFSFGKLNVFNLSIFPPNTVIALFASDNSASPRAPFIAINIPSFLTSGKQYSLNTDIRATALAKTTS